MDVYRLVKGFSHQYLTRWIEHYSPEFRDLSEHDANFLLSSKIRNSKLGDALTPTALERAASDVLAIVCAIEHSISTDEATKIINGKPIIKVLADSLHLSVNILENMTNNNCITKSDLAITELLLSKTSDKEDQPKLEKRQVKQERLILEAITKLGYDSQRIPKNKTGQAGVRSIVKKEVSKTYSSDFVAGSTIFEKAWGRLLSKKEIAYISA